jgi:NAD(P)-dependent dehydrogenase (short-subunit alcohol dehydrogenase family)
VVAGDLGDLAGARALGERLRRGVRPGATLVHNAGLWPSALERTAEGLEASFVVNYLGPLAMQGPLLEAGLLRRVMVVSAGLIAAGRFDAARTPTGGDFSALRTYASTKLCLAVAARRLAKEHREVDWLVLHPGVVRTDLGVRPGALGTLVGWLKRFWESPETCAARLLRLLERERWSPPGEARWFFEEAEKPWPASVEVAGLSEALREIERRHGVG